MKKSLLIIVLFSINYQLFGQQPSQNGIKMDTFNVPIHFSIQNNSEKFKVINQQFGAVVDQRQDTVSKIIQPFALALHDADLQFKPLLKKLKNKERYSTSVSVYDNTNRIVIGIPDWEISNNDKDLKKKNKNRNNAITWKNVTENKLIPGNQYTLNYRVIRTKELLIQCEKDYRFTFKKQLPYIGTALVGGTLLLISESHLTKSNRYRTNAREVSDEYIQLWQNGSSNEDLIEGLLNENNKNFNRSNELYDQHKKEAIYGYVAMGLGLSGYVFRLIRSIQNQKKQEKYCPDKQKTVQINPILNPTILDLNHQQLGLNLTYTF